MPDPKADLRGDLQEGRDALVWKLEGLSEYDVRRPMTPTGTNLLGLVKHAACVELGYFGAVFGRPIEETRAWIEDVGEPNWDMWATAGESREQIVALYHRAWRTRTRRSRHYRWTRQVTSHQVLVHVIAETHRHAGHADVVRELIDGTAGLRAGNDNLAPGDRLWWASYRGRPESAAKDASAG